MVLSCCGTLDHCTLPGKRQLHLQSNLQSAAWANLKAELDQTTKLVTIQSCVKSQAQTH